MGGLSSEAAVLGRGGWGGRGRGGEVGGRLLVNFQFLGSQLSAWVPAEPTGVAARQEQSKKIPSGF